MAGAPLVASMSPYTAPVHINVGGTTYTSCLETLTKFPHSKLAKLFNGTLPVAVDPVKQRYFLDRDGKMFRHILNFLRNSEMILPDAFSEFNLLKKEAAYFEIEDLIKTLEDNPQIGDRTEEHVEQSTDDDTEGTCKTQLHGREKKRRKKKKKPTVKDKQVSEMLVDTENEFTEEQEADLKKETLKGNKSSATLVSATNRSMEEETNVGDKLQVLDKSDTLQVHTLVEKVVVDKELICVVTDGIGDFKEMWCSDQNFKLELPETWSKGCCMVSCSHDTLRSSQKIVISNNCYTPKFPWVAKYLFKQGYKLITSSVTKSLGGGDLHNVFVK